jgi:hypothetical protein
VNIIDALHDSRLLGAALCDLATWRAWLLRIPL